MRIYCGIGGDPVVNQGGRVQWIRSRDLFLGVGAKTESSSNRNPSALSIEGRNFHLLICTTKKLSFFSSYSGCIVRVSLCCSVIPSVDIICNNLVFFQFASFDCRLQVMQLAGKQVYVNIHFPLLGSRTGLQQPSRKVTRPTTCIDKSNLRFEYIFDFACRKDRSGSPIMLQKE